ncbi:hypothetical protein BH23ACI1_BH23ACI1_28590 [soil metagenome]
MRRVAAVLLVCVVGLCPTALAQQLKIHDGVPAEIDRRARYVIYLHGRIIEDQGPRPTHPDWGVYEYRRILEALAADGATVVAEQRPSMTDMDRFAQHVADQVRSLLRTGVAAGRISVIGFSKGGGIAMRTSALLENPHINFVFLGSCGDGDFRGLDLRVWGRILSVYEASDKVGQSCAELFAKSGSTGTRSEVRINLGEQHGAFFRPHNAWLEPVRRWIREAQ